MNVNQWCSGFLITCSTQLMVKYHIWLIIQESLVQSNWDYSADILKLSPNNAILIILKEKNQNLESDSLRECMLFHRFLWWMDYSIILSITAIYTSVIWIKCGLIT